MVRPVLIYGLVIAAAALALQWLEYRYLVRALPFESYVAIIALAFTVLGVWVGSKLTRPRPAIPFEPNEQAIAALGISARECEVLAQLAAGHSNKEIARQLAISPNTVKTHVARLFEKLEVSRRTQAIAKARELQLIR